MVFGRTKMAASACDGFWSNKNGNSRKEKAFYSHNTYHIMRTITLLLSAYIGKLNNAEYLNLMSRLRALIETATPEGVGLTAGEMTEFSELVDQLQARVNYTTASALTGQLDATRQPADVPLRHHQQWRKPAHRRAKRGGERAGAHHPAL